METEALMEKSSPSSSDSTVAPAFMMKDAAPFFLRFAVDETKSSLSLETSPAGGASELAWDSTMKKQKQNNFNFEFGQQSLFHWFIDIWEYFETWNLSNLTKLRIIEYWCKILRNFEILKFIEIDEFENYWELTIDARYWEKNKVNEIQARWNCEYDHLGYYV